MVTKEDPKCEWQPIETAPKDGSDILVCRQSQCSVVRWELERWGLMDGEDVYEYSYIFDYWMPLPKLPESNL